MNFVKGNSSIRTSKSEFHFPGTAEPVPAKVRPRKSETLVIIDGRNLDRECFVRSIEVSHPRISVVGYSSIEEWRDTATSVVPAAILVNIASLLASDPAVGSEIARLAAAAAPAPVVVLAESESFREMIAALDCGARGYIPASVGVDVIVEATRLTSAGGMFLPSASVLSLRHTIARAEPAPDVDGQFTSRQSAVADALRRGRANKIIAYELNMSESTVKVHIRNIMKKLKATNRTEAAFKLNALYSGQRPELD